MLFRSPRLVHQFLTQQTHAEQETPLRQVIDDLLKAQQKQARWQKYLALIIAVFVIMQLATLLLLLR